MFQVQSECSNYSQSLPSFPTSEKPKLQQTARSAYEAAKTYFQNSMENEVSVNKMKTGRDSDEHGMVSMLKSSINISVLEGCRNMCESKERLYS